MTNEELIRHLENLRDENIRAKLWSDGRNHLYFCGKIQAYENVIKFLKDLERE